MTESTANPDPEKRDAVLMMELVGTLTLFTRKTLLSWLPELVESMGLTGERYFVLFELGIQPDSSLKDLAQSMAVSPSALSVMVNSLVEMGLVTRVPDPADRRRVVLRLSDGGNAVVSRLDDQLVNRFHDYLQLLDDATRRELAATSEAMLRLVNRVLDR